MSSIGDKPESGDGSGDTLPDDEGLTRSVRGEIANFFGAPQVDAGRARAQPGGFGRLLADLEERILAGIREPEAPPAQIGPFLLEQQIGRGGFAVVYRGTHVRTKARAAVKLVPADDGEAHRRIVTEVESLIQLRHPNIVRVIDTGENEGFAWVATEYIEGQTLADFIRSSRAAPDSFHIGDDEPAGGDRTPAASRAPDPATIQRSVSWFRDLAAALDALHQIGLVHRDVKPANILIDSKHRPYLIDFGLSSSAESTVNGLLAGTVPYMSPEQTLGGYVAITPRSDVYSLAATFHEVLTTLRVTHGARREAILHEIAFVQVPPPSKVAPGVPATLDPIFLRALSKDSNIRYESAKELEDDLDAWLSKKTLPHAKEARKVRLTRKLRRHPVAIALAMLVILGSVAWLFMSHAAKEREYEQALSRIRAAISSGQPVAALSLLASETPRYGDRNEFRQLHRETVLAGGEPFVGEMLKTQGFAAAALASQASHRRYADEARVHLDASGLAEPHMILAVALSRDFSGDPGGAQAALDRYREVVDRTRFLTELEGVVAIDRKRPADYDAVVARLKRLPLPEPNPIDAGLKAFRLLSCKEKLPTRTVSAQELREVGDDLRRSLKVSEHAFVRMMLILLAIDQRDYAAALKEIEAMDNLHAGVADQAGTRVIHAAVRLVLAGEAVGTQKDYFLQSGIEMAKRTLRIEPSFVQRFLFELNKAQLPIRVAWIDVALDDAWTERPRLEQKMLTFITIAMNDLAQTSTVAPIIKIARKAMAQREFDSLVGTPDHLAFAEVDLFALRVVRNQLITGGKLAEARPLGVEARDIIWRLRSRRIELPFAFSAEDALAAASLVKTESDPAAALRLADEALKLLRNVATEGVLTDSQKLTPSEKARHDAELRDACMQEREAIEDLVAERAEPESR